jgi:hypothetical protein
VVIDRKGRVMAFVEEANIPRIEAAINKALAAR